MKIRFFASLATKGVWGTLFLAALWGNPVWAEEINGKKIFNKCKACHTATEAKNKIGPHLQNIIGRKAGSIAGYKYSSAMKESGIVWDAKSLDEYIANPAGFLPKNKMAFAGLKKPEEREAVIKYLSGK